MDNTLTNVIVKLNKFKFKYWWSSYKIVGIDILLLNITIDEVIIYEVFTKCKWKP